MDPRVSEERVPSYKKVEEKIREIDNTIIISRIYYIFENLNFIYRFQLIKKDKMCMIDIPKRVLDGLKHNSEESEQELDSILNLHIHDVDRWTKIER
jgi:hypothetical protein